jgi:hypothetical protein
VYSPIAQRRFGKARCTMVLRRPCESRRELAAVSTGTRRIGLRVTLCAEWRADVRAQFPADPPRSCGAWPPQAGN